MKDRRKCCLLFLAVIVIALGLRLPKLAERPMHCDEAVHAVKFGELLEKGQYRYDRYEYHGPTLNYFTLFPARVVCAESIRQVNEFTLRIVPAVFGVLLILLLLLLAEGLGTGVVIAAGILTAVSPAMVFYSRYYIHEMLLVCFSFGLISCGYRYVQSKDFTWALSAGIFAGLMHATKETCVVVFGSMFLAFLLVLLLHRGQNSLSRKAILHLIVAVVAALAVSAVFYSSFFTNPGGVADSLKTFVPYFIRASNNPLHIHPWHYYLQMLIYFRLGDGPVWSEAVIIFLAAVGFTAAMKGKITPEIDLRLVRFIGFYTLVMTIVYSAIPYKTPWCLLGFLHGMILLAGVGVIVLMKRITSVAGRVVVGLILAAAAAHLIWQSYLGNYKYYADPVNPYVYAHPTKDVVGIANRVEEIAGANPQGHDLYIQVICSADDYWPLPWYLRFFNNVGWWDKVDEKVSAAPIIIASADLEDDILKLLYEIPPPGKRDLYVPLFDRAMQLRPSVELKGFVKQELWERYQQHLHKAVKMSR